MKSLFSSAALSSVVSDKSFTVQSISQLKSSVLLNDTEEQRRLAALAKKGDLEARNQLILACEQVVLTRIRRRFANYPQFLWEDMFQEGVYGLMIALDHFDPSKEVPFPGYAVSWVDKMICLYLKEQWKYAVSVDSLDEGWKDAEESDTLVYNPYWSVRADRESNADYDLSHNDWQNELLTGMTDRQRYVFVHYYGFNGYEWSLQEIADTLGISYEMARIHLHAAEKIAFRRAA
ncbi:MAG: sigma-70 family RNA polymerase sigma factor [Paludibacteraceae bacterium]|nr:sigma-70 family RNA polymerase sigma factor [Paludibacteraceae bacterium]